jgi:diacylglycerol kinase (ATP)
LTSPPPSTATALTGLLINRRARLGRSLDAAVLASLGRRGIALGPIIRVRHPRGLCRAVDSLLALGVQRLIVGGGDGTLGVVASRLAHREAVMGVLPLGTANDFARTLGIPGDLDAAAGVIADGQVRRVDLGRANDVYFLNVASMGMSVEATAELSPAIKRWFGPFAYLYAGAIAFTRSPNFQVRVQNGPDSIEVIAHQVVVGNGRFYGGGVLVSQRSSLEDGMLSAYALGARGRWHLLKTIAMLRLGVPIDRPGDHFIQSPSLRIETWPTLKVDCDGEIRTKSPVTFAVETKALRVFAPASLVGSG